MTIPEAPPIEEAASPPDRDPRRWLVLAVMSLGTLIVFIDLTVMNTALPSISFDLGASTSQLQWVVNSSALALAGLLLLAGSIGDRSGRRRWMTFGLVVFGAGSVVGALSPDIATLIAGRALQGLGAAFVLPATLSIVTNIFERDERGKAIAIWTAVGGIGIGLGPAVGGYLVNQWGWSAAFWIHLPIIAVALLGQVVVAESRDPRHIGLDIPGAITATLGIVALVFGIIQGSEEGWSDPLIVGSFAAAAVLLATFVAIERRVPYPMLPVRFFANRNFTGPTVLIGIIFFAGTVTFFFLTLFFQIVQGRDPFEAGLLILPTAPAIVVASALGPPLAKRFGPKRLVTTSIGLMAVAIAIFTQLNADWSAVTEISVIMFFGFAWGLGMPTLTDSIMASVPVEDAGIGSAVNDVSRELGSALGVAIIGSFISSIYKANIDDRLTGEVDETVVEMAKDGIAVLASNLPSLGDTGQAAFAEASQAFIDAMNSGFWLNAAVLVGAAAIAAWLLPNRIKADQEQRAPTDDDSIEIARSDEPGTGDLPPPSKVGNRT